MIIRDRDSKFGTEFDRVAKGAGIKVVRTAVKAPLMNRTVRVHEVDEYSKVDEHGRRPSAFNATCERFLGTARRECLDHIIILGRRHLAHVLDEYCFHYFNPSRPHQGSDQRIPVSVATKKFSEGATVRSTPVLAGLHHDYQVAA